jgi:hypothetical protein
MKNTNDKKPVRVAAPLGCCFSIPGHHGRYSSGLYPSAAETGSQAADTTGRAQCGYVYFAGIE